MNADELIGRGAELAELAAKIDAIETHGGAVVVAGEPGIGKSSVLLAASVKARTSGCLILETAGIETNSPVPYDGLHRLLSPILTNAATLPPVQRNALNTAFGLAPGAAPEPFLVALATLNLLVGIGQQRPVVMVVDDVHWMDSASTEVIAFLSRRIAADPLLVIAALRSGNRTALSDAEPPRIELTGLDDDSARAILKIVGGDLPTADLEQILAQSRGNPLALVELPAARRQAHLRDRDATTALMPLTKQLERTFVHRISEFAPATRNVLLVAAVDDDDALTEILAAASVLTGAACTVETLEAAAAAGLITFDHLRITFRHPLVRSGILQAESLRRRQAANAALGEVLRDQPHRRCWYRAQSIIGPDDEVADELEATHLDGLRRGSVLGAISALERSAQLTTDSTVRGRRLLHAAELAFGLGRADVVSRLLSAASGNALTDLDRARMEWLRELPDDGVPGDARRILELCDIARRAREAADPGLALNLLLGAALRCWWADAGQAARARVVEVLEEMVGVQDDPRFVAALAVAEPIRRSHRVSELLSGYALETIADPDTLRLLGMAAHAIGDQPRAGDYFDRAEAKCRSQGRIGLLTHVLGMQSPVRIDLGDWDRAAAAAHEGSQLAADTGQRIWSVGTMASEARACALRGDPDQALALADAAERIAREGSLTCYLAIVQLARGFAHLRAGRPMEAYDALARLFDPDDPSCHVREGLSGVMFLAEAAVRGGRTEHARVVVSRLEELAAGASSPLLVVHLLYARAVLAEDQDAERLYREALGVDLTRWPWVKARIDLAYGSWLRRQRRLPESRRHLRSAQTMLDLIGADSWAELARSELRAAGVRIEGAPAPLHDVLSAHELQIARLAAEGLSNREIGERLFLSHRTVGSHLYRIFPKLDVTSRAQLAARLNAA